MNARRNVDVIAQLAPRTMGWLQVPLTPARAATIAAFETRTGSGIIDHILDFLDDEIFSDRQPGGNQTADRSAPADTQRAGGSVVSRGGSCTEAYREAERSQSSLAAELPLKENATTENPSIEHPTANLPLTMETGFRAQLEASIRTSLERSCTTQPTSETSGCASDTPPAKCARQPISSERCRDATSPASNGFTPPWMDAPRPGGSRCNTNAPSAGPHFSPCGND
jgi:hypothetical protein